MNEFIASVEKSLPSYDCWKGANEAEVESNSEALEYLITKKKYRKLFGNEAKDIQLDTQLQEAYVKFSFIRPEHIEIDPRYSEESSLSVAIDRMYFTLRTQKDQ